MSSKLGWAHDDEAPTMADWQRIGPIFDRAHALAGEAREAYLEAACADQPAARREIESLLAAAAAEGPLDAALEVVASPFRKDDAQLGDVRGRTVGAYRILRILGTGGMAEVYLAERADGMFEQQVAVKVLRWDLASEQGMARFARERQILADLEHPNIARLIDGGVTDRGLPFLTMELVDGVPIDRFCAERALGLDERIALFLRVLDAVAYAHRHLVIHRDLKPSNILVAANGEPKLLDFGISKLLDEQDLQLTDPGASPLTPSYAAPEQRRGEALSTATDVYALGVVLHELLTGVRPVGVRSGSSGRERERVLGDDEPLRPSVALARSQPSPPVGWPPGRLAGDLDTVVLKALCPDPKHRYGSAGELADELRRYLDGVPVRARPVGLVGRLARRARRHRLTAGLTAGAAAVILSLVVALIAGAVKYARDLEAERNEALAARALAESREQETAAVLDYLIESFEIADPTKSKGAPVTVRELLEHGAEQAIEDLEGQPLAQATLLTALGSTMGQLGLYDRGAEALERAIVLRGAELGGQHLAVSDALFALGLLRSQQMSHRAAEQHLRRAQEIRSRQLGPDDPSVAEAESALASALHRQGRTAEAEPLSLRALATLRREHGEDDHRVLTALERRAAILRALGDLGAAESHYVEVLTRRRRLDADDPLIATTLNNLAFVDTARGDYARAEGWLREALVIRERVFGEEHPQTILVMKNLAGALGRQQKNAETEMLLRRVVARQRQSLATDDWRLGSSLVSGLARILLLQRKYREAEPLLREGVGIYIASLGEDHAWVAVGRGTLGACLLALGRAREAERLLSASLRRLAVEASFTPDLWHQTGTLVDYLETAGAEAEAERFRRLRTEERRPPGAT